MDQEIKEKRKNLRDAQSALNDAKSKLAGIQERIKEAESLLPGLQKKTSEAEAEKEKVLEQFALGSATQADLGRVRKAVEKAKKDESENAELVEAMEGVKANLNREFPILQNRVLSHERVVWSVIQDQEVLKLKNLIGRGLVKGFASQQKTGMGDWRSFLEAVAGPYPEPSEVTEFQSSLAKEYQVE